MRANARALLALRFSARWLRASPGQRISTLSSAQLPHSRWPGSRSSVVASRAAHKRGSMLVLTSSWPIRATAISGESVTIGSVIRAWYAAHATAGLCRTSPTISTWSRSHGISLSGRRSSSGQKWSSASTCPAMSSSYSSRRSAPTALSSDSYSGLSDEQVARRSAPCSLLVSVTLTLALCGYLTKLRGTTTASA